MTFTVRLFKPNGEHEQFNDVTYLSHSDGILLFQRGDFEYQFSGTWLYERHK